MGSKGLVGYACKFMLCNASNRAMGGSMVSVPTGGRCCFFVCVCGCGMDGLTGLFLGWRCRGEIGYEIPEHTEELGKRKERKRG